MQTHLTVLLSGLLVISVGACASSGGDDDPTDAQILQVADSSVADATTLVADAANPVADAANPVADAANPVVDAMVADAMVADAMVADAMVADAMVADAMVADAGGVVTCSAQSIDDGLTAADPLFNRPYGDVSCVLSGTGTNVYYDVYTYTLTGPGPHQFIASTCDMATFDTILALYQAPGGTANPFDPAQPCLNIVKYDDDATGVTCGGNTSFFDTSGLVAGEVQLVVSSFDNTTTGTYTVTMSSPTCVVP